MIKINILLVGLNAKYIHSAMALYSISAYCKEKGLHVNVAEYTINAEINEIIASIYEHRPDIIGFSCYIWNIEIIKEIIITINKIMPNTKIVLGGPEVSYHSNLTKELPVNYIVEGEGEEKFYQLITNIIGGNENSKVEKVDPLKLINIPFIYEENLELFTNRILYYETSRGCPFNCQYCLSSVEKGVRFLDLERVYKDLQFLLDKKVNQVKFVDRTFNCNFTHATSIWKYLIEHDNGITNFHFEIAGELLSDKVLEILVNARQGLFQFEIGVQSTNVETLDAINRKNTLENIFKYAKKVKEMNNIHQHLDLIAGLPYENYDIFAKSFNDVYSLKPDQLQLGFLKLLKGSKLHEDCEKYGIVYNEKAPFEVLFTKDLPFDKTLMLKNIEKLLEIFYNSHMFSKSINYISDFFKTPFSCFEEFALFWKKKGYFDIKHNKYRLYNILLEFGETIENIDIVLLKDYLLYDIFSNENCKNIPNWLENDLTIEDKAKFRLLYNDEEFIKKYMADLGNYNSIQLQRLCPIVKFKHEKSDKYVLFNYVNVNNFNVNADGYNISFYMDK